MRPAVFTFWVAKMVGKALLRLPLIRTAFEEEEGVELREYQEMSVEGQLALAPGAGGYVQMGEPEEVGPFALIGQRPRRKVDNLQLTVGAGARLGSGTILYL